ncbi:MAG TPA: hypothetical protein VFQ82_15055 [Stellaceae bacterium]|nr:hypothetical protein [Stellaceae bacterium]
MFSVLGAVATGLDRYFRIMLFASVRRLAADGAAGLYGALAFFVTMVRSAVALADLAGNVVR